MSDFNEGDVVYCTYELGKIREGRYLRQSRAEGRHVVALSPRNSWDTVCVATAEVTKDLDEARARVLSAYEKREQLLRRNLEDLEKRKLKVPKLRVTTRFK